VGVAGGWAGGRAGFTGAAKGIVHDRTDRTGAAAALRAAAEATIDLDGFPRARIGRDAVTDLGLGKDVARADDHRQIPCTAD
jgi:hypothetical protein